MVQNAPCITNIYCTKSKTDKSMVPNFLNIKLDKFLTTYLTISISRPTSLITTSKMSTISIKASY